MSEPFKVGIRLDQLWKPLPTQEKFFHAIANAPDMGMVGYVGALGSGKTWALCRSAIGLCFAHPGIKVLLGRYHSTDLRDTTQAEFFGLIDQVQSQINESPDVTSAPLGHWAAVPSIYTFSNGSSIMFRSLDQAEKKYKSLEIAAFGIDEASEVDEKAALMLRARMRQRGFPHVGFIVSNPTGMNHWLYKWFVKTPDAAHVLFRTNTRENAHNLPANYADELRKVYPPDWVKRYLEGEWGDITGTRPAFPTFQMDLNVRELGWLKSRPILVGIDYGFQSPAAIWCQITESEQLRVLRSWLPREIHVSKLAEGVRIRSQEWFPHALSGYQFFAGHDGHKKTDTGEKTSAEVFTSLGMRPKSRYYSVARGLNIIRAKLEVRDDSEPGLVIDPINERLIEAFEGGYRLKLESDDPEKDGVHDPIVDALRYVAVNNFTPAGDIPHSGRVSAFRARPKRQWRNR